MEKFTLFIDESGNLDIESSFSKTYILCGCSMAEDKRKQVKIYADQIKFKYWGHTNVVFHSREIAKNIGDFEIFKGNPELKENFFTDLFLFLNKAPIILFPVVVDKEKAKENSWDHIRVIKETSKRIILNFVLLLLSKKDANGHIIVEASTPEKDKYYLSSFGYFIAPGVKEFTVDQQVMKETLTSISFVTKNNNDIEQQLADLFAYAAARKYEKDFKEKTFEKNSYEGKIINVLEQKLFIKPENASEIKMKFYKKIQPFDVLPLKIKSFERRHNKKNHNIESNSSISDIRQSDKFSNENTNRNNNSNMKSIDLKELHRR